jgi:hypothetical protein
MLVNAMARIDVTASGAVRVVRRTRPSPMNIDASSHV